MSQKGSSMKAGLFFRCFLHLPNRPFENAYFRLQQYITGLGGSFPSGWKRPGMQPFSLHTRRCFVTTWYAPRVGLMYDNLSTGSHKPYFMCVYYIGTDMIYHNIQTFLTYVSNHVRSRQTSKTGPIDSICVLSYVSCHISSIILRID